MAQRLAAAEPGIYKKIKSKIQVLCKNTVVFHLNLKIVNYRNKIYKIITRKKNYFIFTRRCFLMFKYIVNNFTESSNHNFLVDK